jgi:uncharacterized C2H2 Zn-finger protein
MGIRFLLLGMSGDVGQKRGPSTGGDETMKCPNCGQLMSLQGYGDVRGKTYWRCEICEEVVATDIDDNITWIKSRGY